MSFTRMLPNLAFSDLEKVFNEITRLQKENLQLLLDLEKTKADLQLAKHLAEIESKNYSGIKRYFK